MNSWKLLVAVLVVASCAPPAPPKLQNLDAGDCSGACANLELLGCRTKEGRLFTEVTPGTPCGEACAVKIEAGVDLHPACVARAKNCEEVERCSSQ